MIKKIGLFFVVSLSIAFMLWSANYIYHKQSKGIDFNSFIVSDSASIIYIPNTTQFLKLNLNQTHLERFKLPAEIMEGFRLISTHTNYDFGNKLSQEAYISYVNEDFSIVFKNFDLSIDIVIDQLFSELEVTAIGTDNELNIGESSYYYSKTGDFFTISNKTIDKKTSISTINTFGNFDYLQQSTALSRPTYYKHNNSETYSFSKQKGDSLNGKPVSPINYFKNIPNNFDELFFYGSTRADSDIYKLLNTTNDNNFYTWVKNSILHLKKDSMELLIGTQNNMQNLKYILDEQTLALSDDSLLPTPIFKNNFEINFFKSNYNWKSILPESNQSFSIYTELNNFNIIASSTEAVDWYIKEMQLGNNYYNVSKNISIPNKVNKLYIEQKTENTAITISSWVDKDICFTSTISFSSNQPTQSNSSLPLLSNFLIKESKSMLSSFITYDTLNILLYDNQNIICYDIDGNTNWQFILPSPLIKKPVEVALNNKSTGLVLFMENQITIIDESQTPLPGFPYTYNGASKDGIILKYDKDSDYRILINVNNEIINLDLNGNPVEGWNCKPFSGSLKSKINYSSTNGKDYIYFKDSNDSLHVLNRKGENRFPQHYKFKTIQEHEFITGDITKGNLRLLNYEAGYIKSQFLNDGHRDSLLLNKSTSPIKTKWINTNGKINLLIEEFDKVILFNEFGLVEDEIQKPEANLTLLSQDFLKSKHLVFGNLTKNELYLLSSFGTQINAKPILGNTNFTIIDKYLIVYFNSQIWIYKLN